MLQTIKRIAIGASMVVGATAIATGAASAASITGATIGGSNPSDYYVYGVSGSNTVLIPSNNTNVQSVLDGNEDSPTGNVELARSSETGGFNFTRNTTLTGQLGGKTITLSSLTYSDWFGAGPTTYRQSNFANTWFNEFITRAGYGAFVGTDFAAGMYNQFLAVGGFQASSDPNISYVNQDDSTGVVKIGLAGHYDLKSAYASNPNYGLFAAFLPNGFQASEVVKSTYDGTTSFLYGFSAKRSGLVAYDDGRSHNGNYEVSFQGTKIPEPSTMLGLMVVGGLVAASKRKSEKAA